MQRDRHPKVCKFWMKSKSGCKRGEECDFLHVTLASGEENVTGSGPNVKELSPGYAGVSLSQAKTALK